ncbi:MAG: acetolactate synthase small subunit [Oscillospiraceae bacterium]|nr:acetolactate synthase small subunit [Oscillospiraceae bacterium]
MNHHLLSILVDNHPGVLSRVSGLFSRRGFNIESLAVGTTHNPKISRMTIIVFGNDHSVDQIVKQLGKLVQVITIKIIKYESCVSRELVLVKVRATPEMRNQILQVVEIFRAKIIDVSKETLTIEMTGEADKTEALLEMLADYGIMEVARTGSIALERGASTIVSDNKERKEYNYSKTVIHNNV